MKNKLFATGAVMLALALGAVMAQDKGKGGGRGPAGPGLTLTSPDFTDGGVIDDKYSQKGGQKGPSPKLEWTNVPMGVVSFAILFHDPDGAPGKKSEDVTHWMAFNIPGTARSLPAGGSRAAASGTVNPGFSITSTCARAAAKGSTACSQRMRAGRLTARTGWGAISKLADGGTTSAPVSRLVKTMYRLRLSMEARPPSKPRK